MPRRASSRRAFHGEVPLPDDAMGSVPNPDPQFRLDGSYPSGQYAAEAIGEDGLQLVGLPFLVFDGVPLGHIEGEVL